MRRHLAGAEQAARAHTLALDPVRALNRALLLDELGRYRRRGRFPQNHDSRPQIPAFIDRHGARCAVAHLMEISGQGELVQHVARVWNDARVRDLMRLPELSLWLDVAGLSAEEAARIQPEYCFLSEAEACFCQQGGLPGVAVGTLLEVGQVALVRIDRIEGEAPGLSVGDEVAAFADGLVGAKVLLRQEDDGLFQLSNLDFRDGAVRCDVNIDTARRPVTIDTAIEALRAEPASSCIEVLASDHSGWSRSQCEGGSGLDGVPAGPRETGGAGLEGGGCGLPAADGSLGSIALTSAAILAALLARRQHRST